MLKDGHRLICDGLEVEVTKDAAPFSKGERYTVNAAYRVNGFHITYLRDILKIVDIEKLREKVGKHPFKEFYINNLDFSELPKYSKSERALNFFREFSGRSRFTFDLKLFYPVADTESGDFVWVFPNFSARMKGSKGRQKIRVGRFIKTCFPTLQDYEVESIVQEYKKQFSPIEVTLKEGNTREDFLHAYTHERVTQRTTNAKCLSDSCMRYDKEYWGFPAHPSEAYASGDFYILWAEDQEGRIAGRVVVCKHTNKCGPVYAACPEGEKVLNEELEKRNIYQGSFEGAKLLHLGGEQGVFAPYQDEDEGVNLVGDYLIVSNNPQYENCHDNWWNVSGVTCDDCSDVFNADDVMYVESTDSHVCYVCRSDNYFLSNYDEEYYPDSWFVEVHTRYGIKLWTEEQAEDNAYLCEHYSEWHTEIYGTPNGYVSVKAVDNGEYFMCNIDSLAYPISKMIVTSDYDCICEDNVDLDEYELINGVYEKKEAA